MTATENGVIGGAEYLNFVAGQTFIVDPRTQGFGIVEAFEALNYPFLLGVQFHPELRLSDPAYSKIFEQFIAASSKR
jgi:gamma-glutamyl-gamma-aminobutyrate hydrolase PuuD